jgi:hypothetical protein
MLPGSRPCAANETLGLCRYNTFNAGDTRVYMQNASYVKLREVTLTWDIPQKWVAKTWSGANGAKLSLSGRNLYWWTKLRGGDPEAQNFGAGGVPDAIQRNRELAAYPASRSYWLNFSLDF